MSYDKHPAHGTRGVTRTRIVELEALGINSGRAKSRRSGAPLEVDGLCASDPPVWIVQHYHVSVVCSCRTGRTSRSPVADEGQGRLKDESSKRVFRAPVLARCRMSETARDYRDRPGPTPPRVRGTSGTGGLELDPRLDPREPRETGARRAAGAWTGAAARRVACPRRVNGERTNVSNTGGKWRPGAAAARAAARRTAFYARAAHFGHPADAPR
eukprot:111247-Prymnesium_polylepis.1